jgi:hypothetical protein
MKKLVIAAVTVCSCVVGLAQAATSKEEVKAAAQAACDALVGHDAATWESSFTANPAIVDDIAPHFWSGKGAAAKYMKSFDEFVAQGKYSDFKCQYGDSTSFIQSGKNVYVVLPIKVSFKDGNNKAMNDDGPVTFVAVKSAEGKWLMKSMTFTAK